MNNLKHIIVTGGAGFIGSNFIPWYISENEDTVIVNIDLLTYAGDLDNLAEVKNHERNIFEQGDIRDKQFIQTIFDKYDIRGVIHFAAESHVDNSIEGPEVFITTNVNGTFNLLDIARKHWMQEPFQYKKNYEGCRFHHVSTDEVYGSLGATGLFEETTPYAPNSPYSASKAGSDMLVRSYFHTYGLNVVTTNCSNNYGPKQHDEKLIPTIIRKCLRWEKIPIYGDGKNVRDWLYVLDHCKGIGLAYEKGSAGETYNIGGRNERKNIYIAKSICEILDRKIPSEKGLSYKELISFVKDRAGHDRRYAIDASKIENSLNWNADENFESGILKTVDWYISKLK